MARIRVSAVMDAINVQVRQALDDAVTRALPPGCEVDRALLYREFRRALTVKAKEWERVPDIAVDSD